MKTTSLMPLFSPEDASAAFTDWGANCGPAAIAVIAGLTLDELRPHLGDFEKKHYVNPTLMCATLTHLGVRWRKLTSCDWPALGLVRIQWGGPWAAPGVHPRVAYRHTHWVGAARRNGEVGVFDINAMANGSGWGSLQDWRETMVPWILQECEPGADGQWWPTHSVEIEQ